MRKRGERARTACNPKIIRNAAIAHAEALEKAIARVGGVATVHVSPLQDSVRIDYDPAVFRSLELLATVATVRFNVTHSAARHAPQA